MWIMTENDVLLNADQIEQVYWLLDCVDDSTGAGNWEMIARVNGKSVPMLCAADLSWEEREGMMMRLLLVLHQGGIFKATDLYRKK